MEAFSLLKYWRNSGGGASGGATTTTTVFTTDSTANAKPTTKTIVAAAAEVSPYSSDGEDGPYFDLEFALPVQESDIDEESSAKSQENDGKSQKTDETESESDSEEISLHETGDDDDDEEEAELKLSLSSNECTDQSVALSPSNELFFKGNLVSIEPSTILLNGSEENSKFPVFLVKSATKFRVLLLKLKKSSKSNNGENLEKAEKSEKERENQGGKVSGKSLAVKFKVEEVPLVNLFTRDTSSKESHGKGLKQNVEDADERKLTKEVMQKYLKMVKPFYVRVSKRYVEKLKFSGHLSFPGGGSKGCAAAPEPAAEGMAVPAAPSNVKTQQKQLGNNLQAGLKVVRKHLGKSRSASAAVTAASPGKVTSERRDDSLLQLQDGIQGAILHCKKSFNASSDVDSSILCRSVSHPSHEKSVMMG